MMRIVRIVSLVFLGFVLGLSASAPAAVPVKADNKPNPHVAVKLPSTIPAKAIRRQQVRTVDAETGNIANEFISFWQDSYTGEYTAYVSVYDPNALYGWSPCPIRQCGTIKVINGKIVLRTKDSEQRIGAYWTYLGKGTPNVNDWNWNGFGIPFRGTASVSWMRPSFVQQFDYAGASVYNPAFPDVPNDPCPECGGK